MTLGVDPVELAALRVVIGEQAPELLPDVATDALVRGLDSPALRRAAGASRRDPQEARALFMAAVSELGINVRDEQDALWRLVRHTASQIVGGAVHPYQGASWIWWNAYHRIDAEGDLRIFVGLASEWEDHPEDRAELETVVMEEAAALLRRPAPRRWIKVMARRGCRALWHPRPLRNLQPADLPIDQALREDLAEWSMAFDSTFMDDEPEMSGFASREEAVEFVDRGRRLVERLQESLGAAWHVEYMPAPVAPPGLRLKRGGRGSDTLDVAWVLSLKVGDGLAHDSVDVRVTLQRAELPLDHQPGGCRGCLVACRRGRGQVRATPACSAIVLPCRSMTCATSSTSAASGSLGSGADESGLPMW